MRVHLQQQHTEYKARLPIIDKRLKALGSGARQCEWCDTRHDRGRAACTIYLTAALIQHVTTHTPDPPNGASQASRAPKGATGDEPVDGHDDLPRAEGTHGDQRHGQKGQGDRSGAGHRQAKSQKPGKGRGKPSPKQEDNGSINSQQGDQEPKSLRKLVNLIAQLSLQQEDQLAIWRQDHSYVIFLQTDPRITVAPQLHQIGVKWQEKRSAAPASPGLPLRVVLLNCLLNALQTRVEELLQNPLKLKEAQDRMLATEDGNLSYMNYDVSNHKYLVEKDQAPIPLQNMVGHLRALQDLALTPRLIGRFHATRKLSENTQGDTLPFMLEVSAREPRLRKPTTSSTSSATRERGTLRGALSATNASRGHL